MISVLINGISGRMGHAVYAACNAPSGAFLVSCGVDKTPADSTIACPVYVDFSAITEKVDVIIDFSVPAALPAALEFALSRHIPIVVGTTGLTERDLKLLAGAAGHIPVFQTGNMSLGVNIQLELTKQAAAALGGDFDAEIIEKHHNLKVDAPSGTALMLADVIASERVDSSEFMYGRHEKNKRRSKSEIGIHSVRGGTIVGEHEVLFVGKDEIVEITHKAYSKQVFAVGALRAASYILGKKDGLYNMQNVVTEHDVASHLYTRENQAVITLSALPATADIMAEVFDTIAKCNVFVDMISLTQPAGTGSDIGFSLDGAQLSDALNALKPLAQRYPGMDIHAHSGITKLTVEGSGMALRSGVAAKFFAALMSAGIPLRLVTTSETKIEVCIENGDAFQATNAINAHFLRE